MLALAGHPGPEVITMTQTRVEQDGFGPIEVPAEALWGAQTQRSLRFFAIGEQRMPLQVVHALAQIKRAAALGLGVGSGQNIELVTEAVDQAPPAFERLVEHIRRELRSV